MSTVTAPKKRGRRPLAPARRFGWTPLMGKGQYMELDKFLLHVDHEYQRTEVNTNRVAEIRRDWAWGACGALIVGMRPDGTYWVVDGQHRLLAAREREDIQELPCLVFRITDNRDEPRSFVTINTVRGAVSPVSKFKAMLKAGDPAAMRVQAAVEDVGFRIGQHGKNSLMCIDALVTSFGNDYDSANTALQMCAEIYKDDVIKGDVYKGLFTLEALLKKRENSTILRKDIREKLLSVPSTTLLEKVREAVAYNGRSGAKVYAEGLVQFINKGKRRRIPSILAN